MPNHRPDPTETAEAGGGLHPLVWMIGVIVFVLALLLYFGLG